MLGLRVTVPIMLATAVFYLTLALVACHQNNDDPKGCICVPYYQCSNGSIVTDGANLVDPRKNSPSDEDVALDGLREPPNCGQYYVCCKDPGSTNEQPYHHACGIRRPNGVDSRILSDGQDEKTQFGEFPWQGAVLRDVKGKAVFGCGCVLIDKYWALTVAHCVLDSKDLFVRFGAWDAHAKTESLPTQNKDLASIIIHPKFQNATLKNDLALLKFSSPVKYQPNVDTICLPLQNERHAGETCIVTGWGKDAWEDGKYARYLKKVSVTVLKDSECEQKLRGTRLGEHYKLDQGFVCAGGAKGQDACKGDGGGPLACYRKDGVYVLNGVVAWGIGCGSAGVPGVYMEVRHFLTWICEVTGYSSSHFSPEK